MLQSDSAIIHLPNTHSNPTFVYHSIYGHSTIIPTITPIYYPSYSCQRLIPFASLYSMSSITNQIIHDRHVPAKPFIIDEPPDSIPIESKTDTKPQQKENNDILTLSPPKTKSVKQSNFVGPQQTSEPNVVDLMKVSVRKTRRKRMMIGMNMMKDLHICVINGYCMVGVIVMEIQIEHMIQYFIYHKENVLCCTLMTG